MGDGVLVTVEADDGVAPALVGAPARLLDGGDVLGVKKIPRTHLLFVLVEENESLSVTEENLLQDL